MRSKHVGKFVEIRSGIIHMYENGHLSVHWIKCLVDLVEQVEGGRVTFLKEGLTLIVSKCF